MFEENPFFPLPQVANETWNREDVYSRCTDKNIRKEVEERQSVYKSKIDLQMLPRCV